MNYKLAIVLIISLLRGSEFAFAQNFHWQPIGPWGGSVADIAIAPSESRVLYALQGLSILRSIASGKTWSETGLINGINDRPIQGLYCITVHTYFSNQVYLGGGETLRHSRVGGQSLEAAIDTVGCLHDYQ